MARRDFSGPREIFLDIVKNFIPSNTDEHRAPSTGENILLRVRTRLFYFPTELWYFGLCLSGPILTVLNIIGIRE